MSDMFFLIRNGIVLGYRGYDTEITVPAEAVKIGDNAFQNHPLIESIIIPKGVKQIGFYAFSGCKKLRKIVIPESVKKINKHAFDSCKALEEITYHGVTVRINDKIKTESVFRLIDTKDLTILENWSSSLKYQYLWAMFSANPEDKDILSAIKKNFVKMFKYLIDENDTQTAEKVLKETKLVNKRNLESITKYADEKQASEIQNLLKESQEEKE
ncbi:MAG: leucine-rich repeat domain-containing protein [Oscillospiraceae bacterium]|nr:leucine-rich repeat domain-containing protein [Oscillospiraceae bacterium]